MSLIQSIEFFFASSKSHQIFEPLKASSQIQRAVEKQPTPPKAIPKQIETPIAKKPIEVAFKREEPKKETFYTEWEEKYKKLHATNLLTKDPFHRHALFVVERKDDSPFAKKICEAISTRLMKATYCPLKGSLEDLIKKYAPTHLILTFSPEISLNLPMICIEDLHGVEKDPSKKKALWETLKTSLKT